MSPKKPRSNVAQRVSKYKSNNPDKKKSNKMKEHLTFLKKRLADDKFNEEVKKKQRERKQKQRAAKKIDLAAPPTHQDDSVNPDRLFVRFPFQSMARNKNNSSGFGDSVSDLPSSSSNTPNSPLQSMMDVSTSGLDDSSSSLPGSQPLFCSTPCPNISMVPNESRQAQKGKLIRKKNNKSKMIELEDLKDALRKSQDESDAKDFEICQLSQENDMLKEKMKHVDDWIKPSLQNLSSKTRSEFKTAVYMAKDEMMVGTLFRLRQNTGINFNKSASVSTPEDSDLKKAISAFAMENSCEVPDMRAAKKGRRYYFCYKYVLWMQFKSSSSSNVSYSQFCSYWPQNVVKPKIQDWGSCRCQTCENVEMLFSALKKNNLISKEHDLDIIIKDARDGGSEFEDAFIEDLNKLKDEEDKNVSFLQWEKVSKSGKNGNLRDTVDRVQKTASCKAAAEKMAVMYEELKKHLNRNFVIKKTMRELREDVMKSDDKALIHVDWAENLQIEIPGEVQSAYFSHLGISLHTGYLYSAADSGGFVSLSEENNHRAEAVHSAIQPVVQKLVENGIKHLICVSDSPTSQYRNKTNVWLTKELAVKHNIRVDWLFTEAGHGKSSCDGIGGVVKNLVRDLTAFNTSHVIANAKDVLNLLAGKTSIDLSYHSKEDIQNISNSLPYLGSLTGALKMHQISFDSSGGITSKGLPTDPVSSVVKLKIIRSKPVG